MKKVHEMALIGGSNVRLAGITLAVNLTYHEEESGMSEEA